LLSTLPADFPVPIAVVVHMPVGYTEAFAARLDAGSQLHVREASEGAVLERGTVLVGHAGQHLQIQPGAQLSAHLERSRDLDVHHPSVDVLFESAAHAVGAGVLGVVLTGMGQDGLAGARVIHRSGGRLLVEAESSCVVYGMPRAVAEADLDAESVPLELMARAILERI
jgi:two-component system chemotaxis response regulator CheB